MKVICGLGNPGAEYESTRHNIGWWVVEEAQAAWRFPEFERVGKAWHSAGRVAGHDVLLVEPLTFMNRSGAALLEVVRRSELHRAADAADAAGAAEAAGATDAADAADAFDIARDLIVVVDDTALDVGRIRLRAEGSAGGHNGLKSIEAALGTREYARLRVGVGAAPPGRDLADWVLSSYDAEDEAVIVELLPTLVEALHAWIEDGIEAAANRYNR